MQWKACPNIQDTRCLKFNQTFLLRQGLSSNTFLQVCVSVFTFHSTIRYILHFIKLTYDKERNYVVLYVLRCIYLKKVKVTLVQALRLCTGRTVHRGSRGIALPFHDHGTRRWWGQRHAPAAFYPRERPGTHCTGGYVGPRAGLDRCEKSRPHQDSIPSPYPVAIRTEISRPMLFLINNDWNTLILITPFY